VNSRKFRDSEWSKPEVALAEGRGLPSERGGCRCPPT
jgi:hypothetical protein